jgi:hypothetical protein
MRRCFFNTKDTKAQRCWGLPARSADKSGKAFCAFGAATDAIVPRPLRAFVFFVSFVLKGCH